MPPRGCNADRGRNECVLGSVYERVFVTDVRGKDALAGTFRHDREKSVVRQSEQRHEAA